MREIKFRGKAVRSLDKLNESNINHVNGWVYGNLVMYDDMPFIVVIPFVVVNLIEADIYDYWVKVQPESVGQYTGLKDKNGKEIYEGDIILFNNFGDTLDKVVYSSGCFHTSRGGYLLDKIREIEIIGNIYEHPHLLKEGVTL